MVKHQHASWPVAGRRTETGNIDAIRSAMHGVQTGVAGPSRHLLWFNHFHHRGLARVGLGVNHMNSRRPETGNDKVTPLDVGVRGVRTERRTASIPPEVM